MKQCRVCGLIKSDREFVAFKNHVCKECNNKPVDSSVQESEETEVFNPLNPMSIIMAEEVASSIDSSSDLSDCSSSTDSTASGDGFSGGGGGDFGGGGASCDF